MFSTETTTIDSNDASVVTFVRNPIYRGESGKKDYEMDRESIKKQQQKYEDLLPQIRYGLLHSISHTLQRSVKADKDYEQKMDNNDIPWLWKTIQRCATGASSVSACLEIMIFCSLAMRGNDHQMYFYEYAQAKKKLMYRIDESNSNKISAEDLVTLFVNTIFIVGIMKGNYEGFKTDIEQILQKPVWPDADNLMETWTVGHQTRETIQKSHDTMSGSIPAHMAKVVANVAETTKPMLCVLCASRSHQSSNCPDKAKNPKLRVTCDKCGKGHLTALHEEIISYNANKQLQGRNNNKSKSNKSATTLLSFSDYIAEDDQPHTYMAILDEAVDEVIETDVAMSSNCTASIDDTHKYNHVTEDDQLHTYMATLNEAIGELIETDISMSSNYTALIDDIYKYNPRLNVEYHTIGSNNTHDTTRPVSHTEDALWQQLYHAKESNNAPLCSID